MSTCPNCGKVAGIHSSILQGCMCQYSMQATPQRTEQEPVAKYSDIISDGGLDPRNKFDASPQRTWVGLSLTQVKLLSEGVQEEAVKSGDSYNWVFYKHINEALKDKNT